MGLLIKHKIMYKSLTPPNQEKYLQFLLFMVLFFLKKLPFIPTFEVMAFHLLYLVVQSWPTDCTYKPSPNKMWFGRPF